MARIRLSGSPHFTAAHWKISSVVPSNRPELRPMMYLFQRGSCACVATRSRRSLRRRGMTLLNAVLARRGSQGDRRTLAAAALSPGSDPNEPTGCTAKYPLGGGGTFSETTPDG